MSEDEVFDFPAWQLSKKVVEQEVGRELTSVEFMAVANEMDGRIENYSEALFEDIIEQIQKGIFFQD